jgi:hypothetical protein
MAKTPDALFAQYAASAPRLDLEFYVTYAQRHRDEYSPATRAIVGEMMALLQTLDTPSWSASAQKRTVWALIDRFKGSITNWYGNAGAHSSTFSIDLAQSEIARWVTMGAQSELLDPKSDPIVPSKVDSPQTAESSAPKGPTWRQRALAAEAKLHALEQQTIHRNAPQPVLARPRRVPVTGGEKTCTRCAETQDLYQFAWAAGGALRNICRTCRKAQAKARQDRAA